MIDLGDHFHGISHPDSGLPPVQWNETTLLAATLWLYADRGEAEMLRLGSIIRNAVDATGKPWRAVILALPCWRPGDPRSIQAVYPIRNGSSDRWETAARCAYLVWHRRVETADGATEWTEA